MFNFSFSGRAERSFHTLTSSSPLIDIPTWPQTPLLKHKQRPPTARQRNCTCLLRERRQSHKKKKEKKYIKPFIAAKRDTKIDLQETNISNISRWTPWTEGDSNVSNFLVFFCMNVLKQNIIITAWLLIPRTVLCSGGFPPSRNVWHGFRLTSSLF